MGWLNWLSLAEDISDDGTPTSGDYERHHASRDTDSSDKKTKKAWHQARVDASCDGELNERVENKKKKGLAWWF